MKAPISIHLRQLGSAGRGKRGLTEGPKGSMEGCAAGKRRPAPSTGSAFRKGTAAVLQQGMAWHGIVASGNTMPRFSYLQASDTPSTKCDGVIVLREDVPGCQHHIIKGHVDEPASQLHIS